MDHQVEARFDDTGVLVEEHESRLREQREERFEDVFVGPLRLNLQAESRDSVTSRSG